MNDVNAETPAAGRPLRVAGGLKTALQTASPTGSSEPSVKISGLDFPAPLIAAIRSDQLVVFAGAGVSMPVPAGLPDFEGLAEAIATETGQTRDESEPVDPWDGKT